MQGSEFLSFEIEQQHLVTQMTSPFELLRRTF